MLRRLSQNPVRRYWFHRSKGISFTQLKKRGDHTIQQDAPVIFPINASKFDSIQNMEKNRKRTHTHVSIHHVFCSYFPLCLPHCVPPLWFPRCGSPEAGPGPAVVLSHCVVSTLPFVLRKPRAHPLSDPNPVVNPAVRSAVRSPRAAACSKFLSRLRPQC